MMSCSNGSGLSEVFRMSVPLSSSRCAGGPRQQSELFRGDRRRHGCSHRLLGQFPPDLELKQTSTPPRHTQSLPANLHLATPPPHPPTPHPTHLLGWTWGVHTVSALFTHPQSSSLPPTWERALTLSTFPSDFLFCPATHTKIRAVQ